MVELTKPAHSFGTPLGLTLGHLWAAGQQIDDVYDPKTRCVVPSRLTHNQHVRGLHASLGPASPTKYIYFEGDISVRSTADLFTKNIVWQVSGAHVVFEAPGVTIASEVCMCTAYGVFFSP